VPDDPTGEISAAGETAAAPTPRPARIAARSGRGQGDPDQRGWLSAAPGLGVLSTEVGDAADGWFAGPSHLSGVSVRE